MAGPKHNGKTAKAKPRAGVSSNSILVQREPHLNLLRNCEPQIDGRELGPGLRLMGKAR